MGTGTGREREGAASRAGEGRKVGAWEEEEVAACGWQCPATTLCRIVFKGTGFFHKAKESDVG